MTSITSRCNTHWICVVLFVASTLIAVHVVLESMSALAVAPRRVPWPHALGVRWWFCALDCHSSSFCVPVREIAESQKQFAATGLRLCFRLLVNKHPGLSLGIVILVVPSLSDMFVVGALGMLGSLTM